MTRCCGWSWRIWKGLRNFFCQSTLKSPRAVGRRLAASSVRVTMVERLTARVVSQLAFEGEEG